MHSAAVDHKHIPITYHIPGWVATLALIVMNITSRQELAEPEEMYVDDNFTVGFHFCCYINFCYVRLCSQPLWLAVSCQGSAIHLIPDGFWSGGWECGSADHLRSTSCACGHRGRKYCAVLLDNRLCINPACNWGFAVCREPCCNVALFFSADCCSGLSGQQTLQGTNIHRVPCQRLWSLLSVQVCTYVQNRDAS